MATSRAHTKCLKSTCEKSIACWLKSCNLHIKQAISPVVLYKKVFWKASQNSDAKQEAVILEVSKWCT